MAALLRVAKGCLGLELSDGGLEEFLYELHDDHFEATKNSLAEAYGGELRRLRTGTDKGIKEKS